MKMKNLMLFAAMSALIVACGDKKDDKRSGEPVVENSVVEEPGNTEAELKLGELSEQLKSLTSTLEDKKNLRSGTKYDGIEAKITAKEQELSKHYSPAIKSLYEQKIVVAQTRVNTISKELELYKSRLFFFNQCIINDNIAMMWNMRYLCSDAGIVLTREQVESRQAFTKKLVENGNVMLPKAIADLEAANKELEALNSAAKALSDELIALNALKTESEKLDIEINSLAERIAEIEKAVKSLKQA